MFVLAESGSVPLWQILLSGALLAAFFGFFRELWENRLRRLGICRIAEDDFKRWQSAIVRALARDAWWSDREAGTMRVNDETQQRLATAVNAREWRRVSDAIGWGTALEATRARANRERRLGPPRLTVTRMVVPTAHGPEPTLDADNCPLDEIERGLLRQAWIRLEVARWALRRPASRTPILPFWPRWLRGLSWSRDAHNVGKIAVNEVESLRALRRRESARVGYPLRLAEARTSPRLPRRLTKKELHRLFVGKHRD